ncbi:DPH4 homolog [Phoenix dactylifera]|uniref:DPH4 homolog n=1 Tax=Phoenix dactylifera TaxID=42345 RepID=A0A8B8ZUF8_PHODC|nr:DPH4 homolog [Phoenix dactylifera]XP_038977910.1 DPH4 homolog [Phoenix dactylifera]XP_038977911.1 DPH4 homolog [Phoenix dactylifera]XP_038977912.1 DPH4 homolog [Phoenix dactylifera]
MLFIDKNSIQRTHYDVLSVREDASYDEIRVGYRAAVLSSHPDKLHGTLDESDLRPKQEENFLDVQKAWEVLSDSKSRANYDRELQASRQVVEVVDDEVKLGDMAMETLGDVQEFFHQCRCGDYFLITSLELGEMGISLHENGVEIQTSAELSPSSVLLPCGSCSLKIRLLIDASR